MSAFQPKQKQPSQRTSSTAAAPGTLTRSINQQAHALLDLQRSIGNQAVLRLMRSGASSTPARTIQPKLTVNTPGDALEQEADRVAGQVMRMPEPGASALPAMSGGVAGVQRACACGGTCSDCKNEHNEEHAHVQMKTDGSGSTGGIEAPPIVQDVLRSPGRPLDKSTRTFMEPRFGHDFSRVRIHTDAEAAQSARQLHASAYTVGDHIVFAEGRLASSTPEGGRLLAHELAHVVQGGGQNAMLRRQPDPKGLQADEARLRVRIVDTLEATKRSAIDLMASAIDRGDRAYLEGLGLSSKQVDHLLNRTAQFDMMFGTAAELAVEQAVCCVARSLTRVVARRMA